MSVSADPRWHGPRQPWEAPNAEERKLVRMSIALMRGKSNMIMPSTISRDSSEYSPFIFFSTNSKQEIDENPDSTIVEGCIRGVIGMVDAISEALVAFHLPSEIDTVGLGTFVAKIRNENRNVSAHFIREPNDLKSFYRVAVNTLTTDYFHVFENLYPPVRKALEAKVTLEAKMPYHSGSQRTQKTQKKSSPKGRGMMSSPTSLPFSPSKRRREL